MWSIESLNNNEAYVMNPLFNYIHLYEDLTKYQLIIKQHARFVLNF